MTIRDVLLPLFVQVILTFVLLFWMAFLRTTCVMSGSVATRDIALREPNWPARNRQVQNAYLNQLELPILFYVLTALSIVLRHADLVFVLLAWVFVALRCLQVFVHVTDNDVRRRGALFVSGAIVLAVMWAIFAIRILLGI